MKRVCLNRLKNEAVALSNLITGLDLSGGQLVQDLFDSLFLICQQEKGANERRNSKEVVKLVVNLMVEDIWLNFENYKLQLQIVRMRQPAIRDANDFADFEEPNSKIVELRRHSGSIRSQCSKVIKTKEQRNGRYQTIAESVSQLSNNLR
jgi:hypothetical protein